MSDFRENWMVIVNPNAGGRKGGKVWPFVSEALKREGFTLTIHLTSAPMEATRVVIEAVQQGFRKFIVVGGDGTMHETANGILLQKTVPSSSVILALIPVGTGNDWGRMYGIPGKPHEAIQILLKGKEFVQDVCRVRYSSVNGPAERFSINLAGIGFDAEVVRRTNKSKQNGKGSQLLYLFHLLAALVSLRSTQLRLSTDSSEKKGRYFSISIGICRFKGGGMMTAPAAIPNDGLLDITLIGHMGRLEVIRSLPLLFNGKLASHPKVECLRSTRVRVESEQPVFLEADGELLGFAPLEFEVVPAALRILTGLDGNSFVV